uniref:Replication protein A 32 kDa subunit n=1 Tax=Romanomermis culicivorax TaxID=13658 RepID=A0A915JZA4_ROMCU
MFDNNDFDASFGGGGFTASQASGTGDRKANRPRQSKMAPVSIASIHEMLPGQEMLRVGSEEYSAVVVVGVIRNVSRNGPATFYDVDDTTGPPLTVRIYNDGTEDESPAMVNTYVRVYGALKTFDEKRSLMCYSVQPLQDLNELTIHLLETIQCKLFHTKDAVRVAKDKSMGNPLTYGNAMNMMNGNGNLTHSTALPNSSRPLGSGSTPLNQVYAYLKQNDREDGVGLDELKRHFLSSMTEKKLTDHIDFLCSEGQIYTTIDDEHFKVTG